MEEMTPFKIKLLIPSGPALCLLFRAVTISVISYLVVGTKKIELGIGWLKKVEKCLSARGIFWLKFSPIVEK